MWHTARPSTAIGLRGKVKPRASACYNSDADGTLRRPSASVWSSSLASLEIANIHFWSIIGPSVRVIGLEVVFDGVLELTLWLRSGSLNNLQPPFHFISRSAGRGAPIPEAKKARNQHDNGPGRGWHARDKIVPQKDPLVNACAHFHRSLWCQHVYVINRTVHRNSHEIRAWHGHLAASSRSHCRNITATTCAKPTKNTRAQRHALRLPTGTNRLLR